MRKHENHSKSFLPQIYASIKSVLAVQKFITSFAHPVGEKNVPKDQDPWVKAVIDTQASSVYEHAHSSLRAAGKLSKKSFFK